MACQSFAQSLSGYEKAASDVLTDYHAMELPTSATPQENLLDTNATEVKDRAISWVRAFPNGYRGCEWMTALAA